MQADKLIDRLPQPAPYGPRIAVTDRGRELEQRFQRTMARYRGPLDWIARHLGDRGVLELERLASALWVSRELGGEAGRQTRTEALNAIKPHVSLDAASEAVEEVDVLIAESEHAVPASQGAAPGLTSASAARLSGGVDVGREMRRPILLFVASGEPFSVLATSVATSTASDASISSTPPDVLDALAPSGRI